MNDIPRVIITAHDGTPLGDLDPKRLVSLLRAGEVNGENALTVTTTQGLAKGDRLLWRDGMGYWHEYVVEGAESIHETAGETTHEYYCVWSLQHDLEGTVVTGMPGTGGTPASAAMALAAALAGTSRWAVGTVDVLTTGSASFWRLSGWQAMQELVNVWGGEVGVTITVDSQGVVSRAVNLLTHIGATTATRRFDYGADVSGITRTIEDQLWTARVVPLGAGEETESGGYGRKITIETVNGGVAYLENADAVALTRVPDGNGGWEVPCQVVENPDCETPADLKAWALENLSVWTTPKVSYEADVVQLTRAGMDALGVALGDEIAIVDRTFSAGGLRIEGRVLRIEEDLIDPSATVLTITNLRDSLANTLQSLAKGTADVRSMVEGMSANQSTAQWISDLIQRLNTEANATGGYTYITEGDGIRTYDHAVSDPLVGSEASQVTDLRGGNIRFANSRTAGGDWDFKTLIMSGLIATQFLSATNITVGKMQSADGDTWWDLDNNDLHTGVFWVTPSGVIVAKENSTKGTYVTSTAVSIVGLTWTDGAPVIGTTYASFGTTSTIGDTSGRHISVTPHDGLIFSDSDGVRAANMEIGTQWNVGSTISVPYLVLHMGDGQTSLGIATAVRHFDSIANDFTDEYDLETKLDEFRILRKDSNGYYATAFTVNNDGVKSDGYVVAHGGDARLSGSSAYIYLSDETQSRFRLNKSTGHIQWYDGSSWNTIV